MADWKDVAIVEDKKLLAQYETALWAIHNGRIEGEPFNYRDTVQIMRDIAGEALGVKSDG